MSSIKLFENRKVRSQYDADKEMWYFSIVDIVGILTEQPTVDRARNYWKVLKSRLLKEGNETVTNCNRLKLEAEDGKLRLTDVGNVEDIFRLIQSIPSPKAEPFKQWLAKVGYERMQEINDPGQSIDRARENWQKLGRSEKWIQQRMTGKETGVIQFMTMKFGLINIAPTELKKLVSQLFYDDIAPTEQTCVIINH